MAVCRLLSPAKSRRRQGRRTLRDLAELAFLARRDGKVTMQLTDDATQEVAGDVGDQFEAGFQQLYLFAMRESWSLVNDCPLKQRARRTPSARPPDPVVWHLFAQLAHTLGFESPEVQRLRQTKPFEEKARQVLLDTQVWHGEEALLQQLLTDAAKLYETKSRHLPAPRHEPQMLTDGSGEPVARRQGRCYENAYDRDKQHLFLKTLSQPINSCADSVTSLFVRRSVHHAFFPLWKIESATPAASEPSDGIDAASTREPNGDVDMSDAPAGDGGADDARARERSSDIGMSDAPAGHGSNARGADVDASPNPDAESTEIPQEGNLFIARELTDDSRPALSTVSTVTRKRNLVRRHSVSYSPPAPPVPSSALQLVDVDNSGRFSPRKRPRIVLDLESAEQSSNVDMPDAPAGDGSNARDDVSASPNPDDNGRFSSRKQPRTASDLESAESHGSGKSSQEDAHAESSNAAEVTVWLGLEGKYKECEGTRCNSSQQVEAVLRRLHSEHKCFSSNSEGRGITPEECYDYATSSEGDNRVYVTLWEEL